MTPRPHAPRARSGRAILAATTLAFVGGCFGITGEHVKDAAGRGTLVIATAGDADVLIPPLVTSIQGAQITAQLFDRLAEPDSTLETAGDAHFRPRLARSWRWASDSLSIAFALDRSARWHDGRPVTARDVAFSYALAVDPKTASPVAPLLAGIDSVVARDSTTAVVWFKHRSPRQFFDATYQLWVVPAHLLANVPRDQLAASAFARHPVGSGRFRFVSWAPGQQVTLAADTANYRGRPALDRIVWAISADPGAATRRLVTGEADVWEQLRGDGLAQAARTPVVRTVSYASMDVGYLAFNLRGLAGQPHPLFGDRAMRRALAAAVDRASVVRNVFDTLAYPLAAPLPHSVSHLAPEAAFGPAYDTAGAAAALDALGWHVGAGGTRQRGGRPLRFHLLVPATSSARQRMAVLLQAQFARVGVGVDVDAVDPAAFGRALQTGHYDAILNAWHTDPSPTAIVQQWGAPGAAGRGSANVGGYRSPAFEALVDRAAAAGARADAAALWTQAYAALADDAPAVWLYEPRLIAGVHRRIEPAGMRADAWWADLADWRVAPGQQIARDRAPLTVAAR
ncbi:peptide-binding protein [Gemmatimonadetes bacterium T265]|nr:peptide-binding protein [Gemmatimonadetes bacterium T265]